MPTKKNPTEKAKRKGGRQQRKLDIKNAPIVHHPALQRKIPVYDVLDDEGVEAIHNFAMNIVEQIGCDFRDEESLDYWRKTGAEITDQRVRIGRDELIQLISTNPSSYIHHGRNPERSVQVGDGHCVISPSYGPPFVLDMEGKRRYATLEDLHNFQKLNHMASSVHIAGGPVVEPVDVPVPHRHLYMAYSGLKYSDKPIMGNVTSPDRARDTMAMMKLVFGDEFASNNAVTTSLLNCNSPLVWDETMLGALKVYASNNQAVLVSPFSMAAASTPASTVGTMGVITAEALMAIAFGQLVRRGSPMVFGVPAMTVALNTGAPVHGTPDSAMVQLLTSKMARHYNIPHRGIMNVATSKSVDIMAGYDSMWGMFPCFLSDANWLTMSGGLMEGSLTQSYGKAMIDFEQIDAFYHFAQGIRFDDLDEIFEAVKQVGPGGHFLGAAHTRKSDLFIFKSQNNVTYEQWQLDGCKDANQIGVEKAKTWLARYEEPEMDPVLDKKLTEFIEKRCSEISPTLKA